MSENPDSQTQTRRGFWHRRKRDTENASGADRTSNSPDMPDLDALLPNTDAEALAALSSLPPDTVRQVKITPPAERYPPVAPQAAPERAQTQRVGMAEKAKRAAQRRRNRRFNRITALSLIGSVVLAMIYITIWTNPYSALNPLPPPTAYYYVTATPAAEIASNPLPAPPSQPQATATALDFADYPFALADGIAYQANTNGRGCEWASIGGTVRAADGTGLTGYRVRIVQAQNENAGANFDEVVFSGSARTFGEGGFELLLGGTPQEATYNVQLLSARGVPLAPTIPITTRADCDANVVLLNFIQTSD